MILAVEMLAQLHDLLGGDIVATVGKLDGFFEGADKVNAVPGNIRFPLVSLSRDDEKRLGDIAAVRQVEVEVRRDPSVVSVLVRGVTDHSGGTPMGRINRRDALAAACEMVMLICEGSLPPVESIVFFLDIRSNDSQFRSKVSVEIVEKCKEIAALFGTTFSTQETERTDPLPTLDPGLQEVLRRAAEQEGLKTIFLPSGAGHDAMIVAQAGIRSAMLFVPSRKGLSHNPEEFTETQHICDAIRVQATALTMLDGGTCLEPEIILKPSQPA